MPNKKKKQAAPDTKKKPAKTKAAVDTKNKSIKTKTPAVEDSSSKGLLISAIKLRKMMKDPKVLIVDLRWYLKGKTGLDEYAKGHLPGAVFLDLDKDLSAPEGPGRHPIPSPEQFSLAL